jgi:GT2 family glycosyltransferase
MPATATTPMAVAIVSFNTREILRRCLCSLVEPTDELFVFDNASTDGTAEMLRADFPQVALLASERNVGYGAAANRMLAACRSEYVLLLNTDTQLEPNTLRSLQTYLDQHPRVAVVGPRLVNTDGSLQVSCFPFPSPLFALLRATFLGALVGAVPGLRQRYLPAWPHDQARAVPWVVGAVLAIRRPAFSAVGGFDESFFMYAEESDLCYRLRAAGWRTDFTPVTSVTHLGGASASQQRTWMEEQKYASTAHFYRAHYAGWQRGLLNLIVTYEMARNIVRDTWRAYRVVQVEQRQRLIADRSLWQRILRRQWQW